MVTWNTTTDGWVLAICVLCALSCALVGNFLVLRRMSMMGDAISHAVLPGIAAAFVLTGSRSSAVMFIGAAVVGVLTALFTQWVHSFGKVDRGAAMGVVFTTLFAVGLILIRRAADSHRVDLDPDCVLYGVVESAPYDTWMIAGLSMPRAAWILGAVLSINALLVALFYKELKISSFDPALATSLGINARWMHYLLMIMAAVTTVAAFEVIGSVLVVAMLIVPAAAAHLLTDRLGSMIAVSLVFAALSAVVGYAAVVGSPILFGVESISTSGMMAATAGALFVVVLFTAPRHGVLAKWLHRAMLSGRILREDVLGLLYRLEEIAVATTPQMNAAQLRAAVGAGWISSRAALVGLRWSGRVARSDGVYRLTDQGRTHARGLVRSHRLWETYLRQFLRLPVDHLHAPADRLEHVTTRQMQRALLDRLDQTDVDPHGKRIPQRETMDDDPIE